MNRLKRHIADQTTKEMDAMIIDYSSPLWLELRRDLMVDHGNPVTDAWLLLTNRILGPTISFI